MGGVYDEICHVGVCAYCFDAENYCWKCRKGSVLIDIETKVTVFSDLQGYFTTHQNFDKS